MNQSRRSVAGYLDVEGDLRTWLRLGAAARTERYSDFGSTVDGKLRGSAPTGASWCEARSAPGFVPLRWRNRSFRRRRRTS